jgi:hypothetical protein
MSLQFASAERLATLEARVVGLELNVWDRFERVENKLSVVGMGLQERMERLQVGQSRANQDLRELHRHMSLVKDAYHDYQTLRDKLDRIDLSMAMIKNKQFLSPLIEEVTQVMKPIILTVTTSAMEKLQDDVNVTIHKALAKVEAKGENNPHDDPWGDGNPKRATPRWNGWRICSDNGCIICTQGTDGTGHEVICHHCKVQESVQNHQCTYQCRVQCSLLRPTYAEEWRNHQCKHGDDADSDWLTIEGGSANAQTPNDAPSRSGRHSSEPVDHRWSDEDGSHVNCAPEHI